MGRILLPIAAVVGLALLLWWVATSPDAPRPPPQESPSPAEEPDAPEIPAPPPESSPPPEPRPPGSADPAPAGHADPGTGFQVSGRVVYVGDQEAPGSFQIVFRREAVGGAIVEVSGRKGRFDARFPGPGRYAIDRLVAEGERHQLTWSAINVQEGEEIVLRIARAKRAVLVVADALNGAPLPGARACTATGVWRSAKIERYESWRGRVVHAIPRAVSNIRRADASGRIPLDPTGWSGLAVVADAYAWAIVEVPRSAGGEISVELLPGGALRVRIPRWDELRKPALLVRLEGQTDELQLPYEARDGEVRLRGVLAGRHEVLVREDDGEGEVAGRAEVEVLPGGETEAVIDVQPSGEPRIVVQGRVTVPSAWRGTPTFITFLKFLGPYSYGAAESGNLDPEEGGEAGVFRYRVGGLTPGTYFVEVAPFEFRQKVEVGPGADSFDFALPEPVEVRLRVKCANTGKDLPGAELGWHSVLDDLSSYGHREAVRDADGWFFFRAPPGRIWVSASREGYQETDEEFEVRGLRFGRDIYLWTGAVLLVRFRVDGEDFSGEDLWCDLAGNNGVRGRLGDPEGVRYPNLEPGEYTITVREIPGFEPVPVRKVEVRRGTNEVVVDLVRKR